MTTTSSSEGSSLGFFSKRIFSLFESETPKVVKVQNIPLGIARLILHIFVISFVVFYQLWHARGYQEFAEIETSLTIKVKGTSV